jgi:hypothetical protein
MSKVSKPLIAFITGIAVLLAFNAPEVLGAQDRDAAIAPMEPGIGSLLQTAANDTPINGRAHLERCYDYANDSRFEC